MKLRILSLWILIGIGLARVAAGQEFPLVSHVIVLKGQVEPLVGLQCNVSVKDGYVLGSEVVVSTPETFECIVKVQHSPYRRLARAEISGEVGTTLASYYKNFRLSETDTTEVHIGSILLEVEEITTPFRIHFVNFNGRSVDAILNNETRYIKSVLGIDPIIIQNNLVHLLRDLKDSFSVEHLYGYTEYTHRREKTLPDSSVIIYRRTQYDSHSDWRRSEFLPSSVTGSTSARLLESSADILAEILNDSSWLMRPRSAKYYNDLEDKAITLETFLFERSATVSDLDRVIQATRVDPSLISNWKVTDPETQRALHWAKRAHTVASFYRYVVGDSMPSDFVKIRIEGKTIACCSPDEFSFSLVTRPLKVRALVLENTSSMNLDIGKFFMKHHSGSELRSTEGNLLLLRNAPREGQNLYPARTLKPGEALIIPMLAYFDSEFEWDLWQYEYWDEPDKDQVLMYLQTLSANQDEKFSFVSGCTGFVQTEIIGSDLLRLLERSALAKNPTREYVYGPSTAYLAVEVNGERTPIRSYDPTNLYAWGGLEVGSCPYIYTYSNNTNSWVNQGHILYNFVGKESEGFDEIELTDWNDHSVFLKELDPETSFIDHLYLRVVYDDGHEEIIPANDQLLHIVDGDYMVLNQGDSVEITFSAIKEEQGVQNVFVGAYGYYIPYTLLSKSSRR